MKKRLKTLFYGMSHEHAPGKIATLRKLADDFEVVAIADDTARHSPSFHNMQFDASGYRIVSESEAQKISDIDVVFVETANCDLMEIAGVYAERGIAMHCDKPCGEAMEPYRSIVEKCRAKNVPFQIGYMYRGNPALKWIWKFVAEGGLGDVRFIEADMNHDYQASGYEEYLATFKAGILYNDVSHMTGLQIGLFNVTDFCCGVQFGLVNVTRRMMGVQIGLVNVIQESDVTFLPILNAYF